MAVGVVRGPVPHMDIHLFAFSGFVHSSNTRTYCLSLMLRDSSLFMNDAAFCKIGRFVLFSPQVNDSESGNIAAKTLLMTSFDLKELCLPTIPPPSGFLVATQSRLTPSDVKY